MAPSTPNPNFDKEKLEESLRHQAPEHESGDREVCRAALRHVVR
jgi:hypothetical protein